MLRLWRVPAWREPNLASEPKYAWAESSLLWPYFWRREKAWSTCESDSFHQLPFSSPKLAVPRMMFTGFVLAIVGKVLEG